MSEILYWLISTLLIIVVILLIKYYSTLKKLKKYAELEEKGEKILDHGIEREISKLKEEIELVKKGMEEEKGFLKKLKKLFGKG